VKQIQAPDELRDGGGGEGRDCADHEYQHRKDRGRQHVRVGFFPQREQPQQCTQRRDHQQVDA
jgi:hypothetical protein